MSVYSFESDGVDHSDSTEENFQGDELVQFEETTSQKNTKKDENEDDGKTVRTANFILDHSTFVRGIGNIKRWFNEDFVRTTMAASDERIQLNIFIPSYTLHEFDFVKRGTSMAAINAREAIRIIDRFFENEIEQSADCPLRYDLYIQNQNEDGPNWSECQRYKVHAPLIKEFPNFKTKFDSYLIGSGSANSSNDHDHEFNNLADDFNSTMSFSHSHNENINDIQYENSPSYQNALANSDNRAVMPTRLRFLIRTCIYKMYVERNKFSSPEEHWKLVTEDPITKIWARSFGIDCMNVNEAELLMFQKYDVSSLRLYNPHNHFGINEVYNPASDILQNTVDTTVYTYSSLKDHVPTSHRGRGRGGRKEGRNPKRNAVRGVVAVERTGSHGEYVKKERFDAINFAPRGHGELWKP
ncbi:predicted protein [Scheffersomyces stipitis CBS 6054]|uniref:Uncharacterized protein n=1 Tax=Scheffersomyces stipitis (strain ATCC 58785 / CBS 6054 / NBRC 10063 / NRRL Y-11545) TaxID=322104 RepID=A3LTF1_PICST|nr:predicted protein [Scheffersomyces stipitis CBS 6054]ABN66393.2 predicted protein [Scheffersomyces stipitis CBS 6054]KAG2733227.1 hypothetical protein G9P44_004217 [Scheffersomyces stipitis]